MTDPTNAHAAIDSLGYAAALSELEAILAELERDNVDVDRLASQVQRASELIRLCRERIGNAKLQIEHVVAELGA
ncbi:MAG: exodeoxyribonuclease VII small subunit [Actinobacteria bacterium]|nr:exodeoxyribonuclease VII small subunit [Actinomycetota bacterium]